MIDIDGVIFKHNSHLKDTDKIIDNFKSFINKIPINDKVILMTARNNSYLGATKDSLSLHGIRYDQLIFDLPVGERVLINDRKPNGLNTAIAVNTTRDMFDIPEIVYSTDI